MFSSTSPATVRSKAGAILRVTSGNFLEQFDFFLFGFYATYIAHTFFPASSEFASLMMTFAVFGAGFLMRPIGAIVLGAYIDKVGRRKGLIVTLSIMAAGTFLIVLIPSYQSIGLWAPLLVLTGRLLQGFSAGAELGGVSVYLAEIATPGRKGFYTSWQSGSQQVAIMVAAAMGFALNALMEESAIREWGWRIPFLLSSVLVLLGLWIRKDIDETPDFKKVKQSGQVAKAPLRDTLKHHWREVLIAAGLKVVETAPFYIFSTFVVSYATTMLTYQKSQALEAVTLGALVATVMIPLMGLLSDKIGRQRMYAASVFILGLFIVPWFMLLNTGTTWGIVLATVIAFGVLWAPVTAVLGTLCSEIFSANVRYTGITLGYQLGAALAGGTAPLIATGLLAKYDGDWIPVAWYLAVTVVISLIAIFCASRVKRTTLLQAQPEHL